MLKQLFPRVWIGSGEIIQDDLIMNDISHVISLVPPEKPKFKFGKKIKHLQFTIADSENENISQYFETCFNFIEEGRNDMDGGVLIHCETGKSASGTIIIGYFAWKLQISLKDAYDLVREQKKDIRPNNGFVGQLKIYFQMSQEKKEVQPIKQETEKKELSQPQTLIETYRINISETKEVQEEENSRNDQKNLNQDNPTNDNQTNEDIESRNFNVPLEEISYCCRQCRTKLFTEKDIKPHQLGEGQSDFSWNKRTSNKKIVECTSFFIDENLSWIQGLDLNNIEGRLVCPKCKSRVGSWKWDGAQCSCGGWQTPSFQILKARVDKKIPLRFHFDRNLSEFSSSNS